MIQCKWAKASCTCFDADEERQSGDVQVPAVEGITIQEDEPEEDVSPVVTDDDEDATDDDGDANDSEDGSEDEDLVHEEEDGSAKERSASGAEAGVSGRELQQGHAAERIQQGASRQAELEVGQHFHDLLPQISQLCFCSYSIAGTAAPLPQEVHSPGHRQACRKPIRKSMKVARVGLRSA